MINFKLETSLPIPFFHYMLDVTHTSVEKPSGISYILLVLINESKNRELNMREILESIGVPQSLHNIFAIELGKLIHSEMVVSSIPYDYYLFYNYKIGQFSFTDSGRNAFNKEAILTDSKKSETDIQVFYDVSKNEFMFMIPSDLEAMPLQDNALTEDFIKSNFEVKKSYDDYLKLNKGKKWVTAVKGKTVKIDEEEEITEIKEVKQDFWVGKYNVKLNYVDDKLRIFIEDSQVKKMIESHYDATIISDALRRKNKFKSKDYSIENKCLDMKEFSQYDITVCYPKDINDLIDKASLIVSKDDYYDDRMIITQEGISGVNPNFDFIIVNNNEISGLVLSMFNLDSDEFGIIKLPLLLKIKLTEADLAAAVKTYIKDKFSNNRYIELEKVLEITKFTNDLETAKYVLNCYVSADAERNIVILNNFKEVIFKYNMLVDEYKELYRVNYKKYLETLNSINCRTFFKLTSKVEPLLGFDETNIMEKILDKLNGLNQFEIFDIMVTNGYDAKLIATYINPLVDLDITRTKEQHLIDYSRFKISIDKLKEVTKINNYKNHSFDIDDLDVDSFKNAFSICSSVYENIELFRHQNSDLFDDYDGYNRVFNNINDMVNILEDARKNPSKIKKDLISKKIKNGDYQFVFTNLAIKLENILKTKYNVKGKLVDIIEKAPIDNKIKADLQEFRLHRNDHSHDNPIRKYTADDLRRWTNEVFSLEGENE